MCGIVGSLYREVNEEVLKSALDSLRHRGPDASGIYTEPENKLSLGHRRLSIIDLSAASNQPFETACGRYVLVFNGEVYNFREIAEEMKLQLRTGSDTEVIAEAFAREGIDCLKRFNGMFALAIWDRQQAELILARDRLGIKPLFYHFRNQQLVFASELKAISAFTQLEPNPEAYHRFLHLGFVPAPQTSFRFTYKLEPGYFMRCSGGSLEIRRYWNIEDQLMREHQRIQDLSTAKARFKQLLYSSVEYRMIADVPLGTFLSGGIDSSLVTAVASELSVKPVKTFSIGFEGTDKDESAHARAVAEALGTEHHEFRISEKEARDRITEGDQLFDELYSDSSFIPTMLVSEMARKEVTVALAGDGGDELFLGYGMYDWARRLQKPALQFMAPMLRKLLAKSGKSRWKRASWLFEPHSHNCYKNHVFSQEQYYFSEDSLQHLMSEPHQLSLSLSRENAFDRIIESEEELQSLFDLCYHLPDDLLTKVDRASMRHSLEVRVPLLDHRLVEFAQSIPMRFKKQGNVTKFLMKEVLYELLPAGLFDRPKWGFGVPMDRWLLGELSWLIDEHLNRRVVEQYDVVRWPEVEQILKRFRSGENHLYQRVWALISLHRWLQKNH